MICSHENCKEKAIYGFKHNKAEYCKIHKKPEMVTKPTQYCEHQKRKIQCVDCNGKAICSHGKQKYTCRVCNSNTDDLNKKIEKVKIVNNCMDCNCEITVEAKRCGYCNRKASAKVEDRPSLQKLLEDLDEIRTFTGVGSKYNVNSNTIRQWLRAYKYEVKCKVCKKQVKSFGKICYECKYNCN